MLNTAEGQCALCHRALQAARVVSGCRKRPCRVRALPVASHEADGTQRVQPSFACQSGTLAAALAQLANLRILNLHENPIDPTFCAQASEDFGEVN
jgi:hypothetical protein